MKLWKYLVILAMAFSLVAPAAVFAVEGEPEAMDDVKSSFQNPTQADRAERIAEASFSEAAAQDAVNDFIGQITEEYAYSTAYDEAYTYAKERATSDAFSPNAYKTAYDYAISQPGTTREEAATYADNEVARIADDYAVSQAVAGNETYDNALDYAVKRATSEDFYPNASDTAYEKYYAEYIGATYEEIHKMRFEQRMGWGQITKYYGLHSSINGSKKRARINEEEIAPRDPEAIPLDDEIAEATRRDTKAGWNGTAGFNSKSNKNKGSKKTYGLTQTSGVATNDVQGSKAVNRGQSKKNNKSSSSVQTTTSTSSQSAQGGSPGIGSSSKSKGSNKGGNSSSKSNKGGNSSNNGNNGGKSSDKGNNGNNGNSGNKGGNGKNK